MTEWGFTPLGHETFAVCFYFQLNTLEDFSILSPRDSRRRNGIRLQARNQISRQRCNYRSQQWLITIGYEVLWL